MLRVFIFDEDESFLKLLTILFENKGHSVQSFKDGYSCPLFQNDSCECPAQHRCADAVLVNIRPPNIQNIDILLNQDAKGCKLIKANKAVISTSFTEDLEKRIRGYGFHTIKKPSRLSKIDEWLEGCSERLMRGPF